MYPIAINYLAVIAAAILAFGFGSLWYGVVLAKPWMAAQGFTREELEADTRSMGTTFGLTFLVYLFLALVMAMLVDLTKPVDVNQGLWLGLMAWFGFMVPVNLTSVLYARKGLSLFVIDAVYQLIIALMVAAVVTAWR
ncbi:MAG: DUF1761 domain-containing protein [marine benthic group bacterium]|jgi:hypothetical protein|nr:DUF1761 domain-containing protein [Gemmatimonadota bacterium]MCL7963726.1 DUF1761 domain-containing protein [Candidatus Carthagonibacter metallireducens]MCL7938122.1 DUF1761 domain-containing protein [Gemmatimonadota bacterium]MCL7958385.1 DUF1761 domain-containing protein [Gemmatimonadota bacterium]MCL7965126.1 DUF1761 domain-containing protein [Gemmatimonadota bacterium]